MKVIDLYTKLANKEIIPRYIKVCERKYEFDGSDNEYYPRNENDNDTLLERISRGNVWVWLNTEVQELNSLEEEKKIPEKFKVHSFGDKDENGNFVSSPFPTDEEFMNKINDIIDYLTYLKSKGE